MVSKKTNKEVKDLAKSDSPVKASKPFSRARLRRTRLILDGIAYRLEKMKYESSKKKKENASPDKKESKDNLSVQDHNGQSSPEGVLSPENNIKQENEITNQELIDSLLDEILLLRSRPTIIAGRRLSYIKLKGANIKIEKELAEHDGKKPLIIRGIAMRQGIWNGTYYPAEELKKAHQTLKNKPLRLDHSRAVRDTVGKVLEVSWDEENKQILFKAVVFNAEVIQLIKQGLVDSVSVGVYIEPKITEMGETAFNLQFHELSIVTEPAVNVAKFVVE